MVKYQDDDLKIESTQPYDLLILSRDMRKEDRDELINFGHTDRQSAVMESFEVSDLECFTVRHDDTIAMIFGLRSEDNAGRIWMLATDHVKRFPKKFLKLAKQFINEYLDKYKMPLFNYIHEDNKQSMKLLKFCGASFERIGNTSFLKFTIGESNV